MREDVTSAQAIADPDQQAAAAPAIPLWIGGREVAKPDVVASLVFEDSGSPIIGSQTALLL